MVPSTRPSAQSSPDSHTRKVIQLTLSDGATIDSFTAAMAIGRALKVYASASEHRNVSQNQSDNAEPAPTIQSSLAGVGASDANKAAGQALMTTGLAYLTKAMRKLNFQIQGEPGFRADDNVISTVLELSVCELLLGDTTRGEIHCQGKWAY